MKVGIVIPCRNDQQYLKECLQSVIDQTVKPASVVVVDDFSDEPITRDDFPEKWGGFPVWLIRNEEKLGLAYSRNIGVTLVGTPWFVPLDSDDLFFSNSLEILCAIAHKHHDVEVIQGGVEHFGEGIELYQDLYKPLPMTPGTYRSQCPSNPTALIKKVVWERLGGYSEIGQACQRGYEDWDFWIRVAQYPERIPVFQTSEPILKYRIRKGSKLSKQDYDAARIEMIVRYRHLWEVSGLASTAIRELRDSWGVQKVEP